MEVGQQAVVGSPRIMMIGLEVVGYCTSVGPGKTMRHRGVDAHVVGIK